MFQNKKLEDVLTKDPTEAEVEKWAIANPHDAKEFGMRLVMYAATPDKLDALPSLGKFQDQLTAWAKKDPAKAKEVLMKLFPKIMMLTAGGKK
jgi:hypothetical protein